MTKPRPPKGPQAPEDLMPGEAGLRSLYGKLPQDKPGPALDAAVLRAAAAAVSASDAATGQTRSRAPRWLIGLCSAATLVLAAGLAWHMRSMPQTDSVSGSTPATTDDVATKAVSAPARAGPETSRESASVLMAASAAIPLPPEPPKQPPPKRVHEAARSRRVLKTMGETPAAQAVQGYAADALRAPPAPPAPRETEAVHESASSRANAETDTVARPPPKIEAQIAALAPSAPVGEMASGHLAPADDPARQLQKIRQLYAQGHDDEARQKLLAFRRAHPQWTLPDDLAKRLQQP